MAVTLTCFSILIALIIKGNFNILEQHHQRNRPNRPPTVSHLTSVAMQQEQPPSAGLRTDDDIVSTNGDDDEVANEDQQAQIPHHPKSQGSEPHPKTIKYYPGSWRTVLERSKQKFVRHTFINQGFALCDNDLGIARKIIHQEIVRGRAEELTLDNGRMCYFFLN